MDFALYIIKLFGSYFLLLAILFTFLHKKTADAMSSILKDESLVRALGLLNLFFGLALILCFLTVATDERLIVQILSILLIISGIARLIFYTKFKNFVAKVITKKNRIIYLVALWLVSLIFLGISFR